MPQAFLLASGESQRAAGVLAVVATVVGVIVLGMLLMWAREQSGRLYARWWNNHQRLLLVWGGASTSSLVLAFIFWSYPLAIAGAVSWLLQGLLWYSADSTEAFDEDRLRGGSRLGTNTRAQLPDLPPWVRQGARPPAPEPRADPNDTSWQDW